MQTEEGVTHLGLEAALKEILEFEAENVIELHFRFVQHADTNKSTEESVALEQPHRILLILRQKVSGSFTDLGQGQLHPPYLAFVSQAKVTDELQLLIEAFLLIRPPRRGVGLATNLAHSPVHHLEELKY